MTNERDGIRNAKPLCIMLRWSTIQICRVWNAMLKWQHICCGSNQDIVLLECVLKVAIYAGLISEGQTIVLRLRLKCILYIVDQVRVQISFVLLVSLVEV